MYPPRKAKTEWHGQLIARRVEGHGTHHFSDEEPEWNPIQAMGGLDDDEDDGFFDENNDEDNEDEGRNAFAGQDEG